MKPSKIEISYKTIVFTVVFIISLFLLWALRDLIFLFFVCFMLMEALNPIVNKLQKLKIPRLGAIVLIYIAIITFFSFVFASIIPVLVEQTSGLVKTLPYTFEHFQILGYTAVDLSSQLKIIETIPGDIAKTVVSVFSNILSGFFVLVITLYLLLERKNFDQYSLQLFGHSGQSKAIGIVNLLEKRLGSWVIGELVLMSIIGLLSYLGYLILGLEFAVPLALIAGILELVPNIGPIFSTLIAAVIGLTVSPLTSLLVIIWGIIIQQLENNLIVPKVMKEAVGLSPIVTIFTIAVGAKFGGIGGAIIAVPIYLTIETVIRVLYSKK